MRRAADKGGHSAPGAVSGAKDVRLRPDWQPPGVQLDRYVKATDPDNKAR
jgi:hypothetical protein